MRAEEIRHHLRQEPFTPFRVFLSDGSTYDVEDSEFAYVTAREFIVGIDFGRNGMPRRSAYLDPIHVTRIEPRARSNGRNGEVS
jgi:hypothetical protein